MLFQTLLFVLSASLDILAVAIAYGTKNIKIGLMSNFVIALISAIGTMISMFLGSILLNIFSLKSANLFGAAILLILGIYFIFDHIKTNKEEKVIFTNNKNASPSAVLKKPEIADIDKSGAIELKESFLLAIALALNNFALGITASITNFSISLVTLFTFIFSILLIPLGLYLSKRCLTNFLGKNATLLSGILLIILAFIELF